MFKKILVPVDGSDPSEKAVTFALELAISQNAQLRFCHVPARVQPRELGSRVPFSRGLAELQWGDARETGLAILDAARSRAEGRGVEVETILHTGTPADAIVDIAERDEVDLIVMGSRAHASASPSSASVAANVLRRAPVPVLVVGGNARRYAMRVGMPVYATA